MNNVRHMEKHLKGTVIILILSMALLSCTSTGSLEATVSLPAEEHETENGTSVTATSAINGEATFPSAPREVKMAATTVTPEDERTDARTEDDAPVASGKGTVATVPATVDFRNVTPLPAEGNEEPAEMPPPGAPDPARTMAEKARIDLAGHLDVSPLAIDILSTQAVRWPDSSLGCPRPGQSYLTVITPGFEIILQAEGQIFEYHTDREQRVVRCNTLSGPSRDDIP